MAQSAPAAIALARSPEYLMPPSAITGTSGFFAASAASMIGGELRHADARDDARGADRARPDADLDRVRARIDQRLGAVGGGDIAGHDLGIIGFALDARDRLEHALGMAVRGVDHDDVAFRLEQRHARGQRPPRPTLVAAATRRRPRSSLQALGYFCAFSMSLTVIRPTQR